jgi:hypothetical protein
LSLNFKWWHLLSVLTVVIPASFHFVCRQFLDTLTQTMIQGADDRMSF